MSRFKALFILVCGMVAAALMAEDEEVYSTVQSPAFAVDSQSGVRIAAATETLTYATNGVGSTSVTVKVGDRVLTTASGAGTVEWVTTNEVPGKVTLSHQTGAETQTAEFVVLEKTVVLHAGTVVGNEVWASNLVHLVTETVDVPSTGSLLIQSGAIVKFMQGTALTVASENGCTANGAIFTHIADDTIGGDTLCDGTATRPTYDAYTLDEKIVFDDRTEFRYITRTTQTVTLSGTLSKNETWKGYKVYHVTGDVTVPSGVTLTIEPGAIVKFDEGKALTVSSGGVLNAQGTRAQPIILTSIFDDEFGGDTNDDDDATRPQAGDWSKIATTGGTVNMAFVQILYSSRNSVTGAINMNGGTVTFVNGLIAHGCYDAIGVESGHLYMTNSVIYDCLLACRHWPKDPIVNCVIYDCGRLTQGGGQTFVNCIFSHITETWEGLGFPGSTYKNCCFWNENGSVLSGQDAKKVCGSNGNIWGDPLFEDPDNLNFRLKSGSPCIDAGNGAYAPTEDYYGQPRQTFNASTAKGTKCASGNYPDIGIYELQVRSPSNDIDLALDAITVDASATIGGMLTVSWTVENIGSADATDPWRDAFELIDANGATVSLGSYTVTGGIVSGGKRVFTSNFRVPSMAVGAARLRVKVNPERDIFEGAATENNVAYAEGTIDIALAAYSEGDDSRLVLGAGASTAFTLPSDSGITALIIRGGSDISAYGAFGYVPMSLRNDVAAVRLEDGSLLLTLPSTAGTGDFTFVLANGGTGSETVTIEPVTESFEVTEVTPTRLANTGDGYLTIRGIALDTVKAVRLVGSATYVATTVDATASGELTTTLPLADTTPGMYTLEVENEDGEVSRLDAAVEIYTPKTGPKLEARLEIPTTVRQGRVYTGKIIYANTGDTDMLAPYLTVDATGAKLQLNGDGFDRESICVLGISSSAPAGILKHGDSGTILFTFRSGVSPRLTLSTDADDSAEWSTLHQELSDAATILNRRGRTVVERDDLEKYIEFKKDNPNAVAISGKVVSRSDGTPIEDIAVVVTYSQGDNVFCLSDTTDENGVFVVDGIEKDSDCKVTVQTGATNEAHVVSVGTSDLNGLTIAIAPKKVIHTVFSDLPIAENAIVNVKDLSGNLMAVSKFNAGEMDIAVWTEESYLWLEILDVGYVRIDPVVFESEDSVTVEITNENVLTRMSGTVCDKDSNALSNAVVYLQDEYELWNYRVTSDESGHFQIDGIAEGNYTLSCSLDGYESVQQDVTVEEDLDNELMISLTQKPGCKISGVCGGIEDGSRIVLRDTDGNLVASGVVDDNRYELLAIEPGTYSLMAVDEDGWPSTSLIEVQMSGADVGLDIDIGQMHSVNIAVGEEAANSSYAIVDGSGYSKDLAVADGKSKVSLLTGRYWFVVSRDDGSCESTMFDVAGDCSVTFSWHDRGAIGWRETDRGWPQSVYVFKDDVLVRQVDGDAGICDGLAVNEYRVVYEYGNGYFTESTVVNVQRGVTNYPTASVCMRQFTISTECDDELKSKLAWVIVESDLGIGVTVSWKASVNVTGFPADVGVITVTILDEDYNIVAHKKAGDDGAVVLNLNDLATLTGEIQTDEDVLLAFAMEDGQYVDVYANEGTYSCGYVPSSYLNVYICGQQYEIRLTKTEFENLNGKIDPAALMPKKVSVDVVVKDDDTVLVPNLTVSVQGKYRQYWDDTDSISGAAFNLCSGDYEIAIATGDGAEIGRRSVHIGNDDVVKLSLHSLGCVDIAVNTVARNVLKASLMATSSYLKTDTRHQTTRSMEAELRMYQEALGKMVKEEQHCDCGYNDKIYKEYVKARLHFIAELGMADSYVYSLRADGNAKAWDIADRTLKRVSDSYELTRAVEDLLAEGHSLQDILDAVAKFLNELNTFMTDLANSLNKLGAQYQSLSQDIGLKELEIQGQDAQSTMWFREMTKAKKNGQIDDYNFAKEKWNMSKASAATKRTALEGLKADRAAVVEKIRVSKSHKVDNFIRRFRKKFKVGKYGKFFGRLLSAFNAYQKGVDISNDIIAVYDRTQEINDKRERWGDLYLPDIMAAYDRFQKAYLAPYHKCKEYSCPIKKVVDQDEIVQLRSYDPNEMGGIMGRGDAWTQRYVKPGEWMTYTVYFENKSTATAAAQEVRVTNPLSKYLDWSTFEMGEVAFNNQIDLGLSGKQNGTSEVKMNGTNYYVRSSVALDTKTGTVTWYQRIVDKTTDTTWPVDVFAGFLPPNDETFCGEGHLTYRVKVCEDAPAGVRIDNSATIVFDYNDPLETNPAWWNFVGEFQTLTIDCGNGTSNVLDLVVNVPFGELPQPVKKGYKFKGWFLGPNGTGGEVTADTLVPSGLTTLYPEWEEDIVYLTVDGVGQKHLRDDEVAVATFLSVTNGFTNLVCRGWHGTGDVPGSGTSNSVSFVIRQESELRWLYATNYLVRVGVNVDAAGQVVLTDAAGATLDHELWTAAGTNLTVEATANEGWLFAGWRDRAGDCEVTGLSVDAHAGRVTLPVTQPWLLEAVFTGRVFAVTFNLGEHGVHAGGGALTQVVSWNEAAVAPTVKPNLGWTLVGWDTAFDQVTEELTINARYERNGVQFAQSQLTVAEGGSLTFDVFGGAYEMPTSAQVYLTYQTAAAADIDLKTATVDGVTPKGGVKFPLTLTWAAGEIGTKTIVIPVKTDTTVEADETLVFQLANASGQALGSARVCTVTIHDAGYDALKAKIDAGTATKAEQSTWKKLTANDGVPYVAGLADPSNGGKVTGSGYCAAGKKVTLKATANKNFVFRGWYTNLVDLVDGDEEERPPVWTTPSLVFDRGKKPAASSSTQTVITNVAESVTRYARFITADEDRAHIVASVDGLALAPWLAKTNTQAIATNVWAGVYLEWPICAEALSATTVKVAGLPSGLKFTAKPVTTKVTTGTGKAKVTTVVTNIAANTIYGAPTAASKATTNKKTGLTTVTPSQVKVTVTTAGKNAQTYEIDTTVDPLPAWAVGTFTGPSYADRVVTNGLATVTIAANGKISAKQPVDGKSVTFAANYFDRFVDDVFYATLTGKSGKTVVTNEMAVFGHAGRVTLPANGATGSGTDASASAIGVTNGVIVAARFDALQYNWKIEPWKTFGKAFNKQVLTYSITASGVCIDADDEAAKAAFVEDCAGTVTLPAEGAALPVDGTNVVGQVTVKLASSGTATVAGTFAQFDAEGRPLVKSGKLQTVKATGSTTLVPVPQDETAFTVFIYLAPKNLAPHVRVLEFK